MLAIIFFWKKMKKIIIGSATRKTAAARGGQLVPYCPTKLKSPLTIG
jgi:hypothetical protein